jgi:hypothetical protein
VLESIHVVVEPTRAAVVSIAVSLQVKQGRLEEVGP